MGGMFIGTIKNRRSPPCAILGENYRDEGKFRHRTLANLSSWPDDHVFGLHELLKNHSAGRRITGMHRWPPGLDLVQPDDFTLGRKMILQEVTEETENEEMMQNPSFTRKANELRPGFRRNPLNLCYLCYLL
jgi:hypothetical protein